MKSEQELQASRLNGNKKSPASQNGYVKSGHRRREYGLNPEAESKKAIEQNHWGERLQQRRTKQLEELQPATALCRLVTQKVQSHLGVEPVSVFDGMAGFGKLEQFLPMSDFTVVESSEEAIAKLKADYAESISGAVRGSFLSYLDFPVAQVTIMKPPLAMTMASLSPSEKENVKALYPWKHFGDLLDVFILKGLQNSLRWGVFVVPASLLFLTTWSAFRYQIGNRLAEIVLVRNGILDSDTEMALIVIDKQKKTNTVKRSVVDLAKSQIRVLVEDVAEIDADNWRLPDENAVVEPKKAKKGRKAKADLVAEKPLKRLLKMYTGNSYGGMGWQW